MPMVVTDQFAFLILFYAAFVSSIDFKNIVVIVKVAGRTIQVLVVLITRVYLARTYTAWESGVQ